MATHKSLSSRSEYLTVSAFVIIIILFGVNFVATRMSNQELAPFWGVGLRFTIASFILFTLVFVLRIPLPEKKNLKAIALYGLLSFGISFALMYWALVYLSSGMGAIAFSTLPLMTLLIAAIVGLERLKIQNIFGAILAFVGVVIAFQSQIQTNIPPITLFAVLGAVTLAASATIILKRVPKNHPIAINAISMTVGAVFLLCVSLIAREPMSIPALSQTWIAVGWLVMSSIVGFVLFAWILTKWKASSTNYAVILAPLVTVLTASLLTQEQITLQLLLGGAVTITGAYIGGITK